MSTLVTLKKTLFFNDLYTLTAIFFYLLRLGKGFEVQMSSKKLIEKNDDKNGNSHTCNSFSMFCAIRCLDSESTIHLKYCHFFTNSKLSNFTVRYSLRGTSTLVYAQNMSTKYPDFMIICN